MEQNDQLVSVLGTAAYLEVSVATPHPPRWFGEGSPILQIELALR